MFLDAAEYNAKAVLDVTLSAAAKAAESASTLTTTIVRPQTLSIFATEHLCVGGLGVESCPACGAVCCRHWAGMIGVRHSG